jgi:Cu(I)/Ag(I) efflux system membrane protein CusA/SilA
VGSFWLLYLLNYNVSTAVWVGLIALAGISAETGIVMLLFLDLAYEKWKEEGRLKTMGDLREAVMYGAVKRLRPKVMTVATNLGLIPILFSTGTGADVMQRIAAPVVGGLLTSLVLVLIIFPVIYMIWRGRELSVKSVSVSDA